MTEKHFPWVRTAFVAGIMSAAIAVPSVGFAQTGPGATGGDGVVTQQPSVQPSDAAIALFRSNPGDFFNPGMSADGLADRIAAAVLADPSAVVEIEAAARASDVPDALAITGEAFVRAAAAGALLGLSLEQVAGFSAAAVRLDPAVVDSVISVATSRATAAEIAVLGDTLATQCIDLGDEPVTSSELTVACLGVAVGDALATAAEIAAATGAPSDQIAALVEAAVRADANTVDRMVALGARPSTTQELATAIGTRLGLVSLSSTDAGNTGIVSTIDTAVALGASTETTRAYNAVLDEVQTAAIPGAAAATPAAAAPAAPAVPAAPVGGGGAVAGGTPATDAGPTGAPVAGGAPGGASSTPAGIISLGVPSGNVSPAG